MQIVLIGAQGTGKTSVMNALPQDLKQYGIREVIRNMAAQDESVKINYNSSDLTQDRFFFEYLYLFSKYQQYISDRGLLDVCAYTKWLTSIGVCSQHTYEKQLYILKEWMRHHKDTIHVYFPIYFPVVDDGCRDTNEDNRKQVDQCIQDVIEELIDENLWNGYQMDNISVKERVDCIVKTIEMFG